ncbi:WD40/YVTN/BNR-like repeat-containing protein [Paenibacillus azoreducens]|uniref:WD40/YVTN/BNR-like repeat-containing protein n=1 Tax=Paenibacillus azoreducens TaxID=116718 RepID=UPI0039F5048A
MKRYKQLVGIMLLCIGFVSGCSSSEEPNEPAALPPAVEDSVEVSPEQGQTLTVVPPEASNQKSATDKGKYRIQTKLTDFQLLSETKGIAWGVTRNELRLYLTKDNGRTWVNISPSPNVQFPANPRYGKDIYFTDPMHGWIVVDTPGMPETIVLHTSNGGEEWDIASFPQKNKVSAITFDSPKRGWIMATEDSSTGKELKVLYRTDDGGSAWNVVMQNSIYDPAKTEASSPIPHLGYTIGISFTDSMHGYVLLSEHGEPKLYRTNDGGNKWMNGPVFLNKEKMKTCSSYTTGTPQFFDSAHREGWIPVGCQIGDSVKYNGYFTMDGGLNWNFVNFGLGKSIGFNQSLRPTFINSSEGWALLGATLYHTIDQGKNWAAVPDNSVLRERLKDFPEVVKLQFSSPKVGWMLIENIEKKSSRLLQTMDGGITWRVL